jgi:hypothetical protein
VSSLSDSRALRKKHCHKAPTRGVNSDIYVNLRALGWGFGGLTSLLYVVVKTAKRIFALHAVGISDVDALGKETPQRTGIVSPN